MSKIRKIYFLRLIGRCIVLVLCASMCFRKSAELKVLNGFQFFRDFTGLHVLWMIWMFDMICQLIPVKASISIGSQKLFKQRFRPIREKINYQALRRYIVSATRSAYLVFITWTVLAAALGWLCHAKLLNDTGLFMITVFFYVCDLICVLIWCPFRLLLKNRCCTTCRIFNWDHLMMFTPMLFVKSFFSWSLLLMAAVVWLAWELCIIIHPERFWEHSNEALKCSCCTDKLCTQYCQSEKSVIY